MNTEKQKMTDGINTIRGSLEVLYHYFNGENPYGLDLNNETMSQFTIVAGQSIMDLEALMVMESMAMPSVMVH